VFCPVIRQFFREPDSDVFHSFFTKQSPHGFLSSVRPHSPPTSLPLNQFLLMRVLPTSSGFQAKSRPPSVFLNGHSCGSPGITFWVPIPYLLSRVSFPVSRVTVESPRFPPILDPQTLWDVPSPFFGPYDVHPRSTEKVSFLIASVTPKH